ncbi:MAG: CRISPR-associated DxTHG motif protein [Dehalococcoidia bacterium]
MSAVNEGDEVILNITHSFRSIPLMAFTVAAYLRATKKATISRIVSRQGEPAEAAGPRAILPG